MADEKRLFRVDFTGCCYVMATSGSEASRLARRAVSRDADSAGLDCGPAELVRDIESVDHSWREAPPFGTRGARTIAEILGGES